MDDDVSLAILMRLFEALSVATTVNTKSAEFQLVNIRIHGRQPDHLRHRQGPFCMKYFYPIKPNLTSAHALH